MSSPEHDATAAHDLDAEAAVLGAVLSGAELPPELVARDFYREENRLIFSACRALVDNGSPPDLVTVGHRLNETNRAELAGGAVYLSGLVDDVPDVANVGAYADIIRDKAATREAVKVARRVAGGGDIEAVSNELKGIADRQAAGRRGLTVRRVDELLAMELPPPEPIVTGLVSTDEILQVVAFRGTGKTYLGLTLAVAIAAGVDPIAGWSVPTARPTLYVDGELPMARLQGRVAEVRAGLGVVGSVPMYTVSKTDSDNRGRFRSLSTIEGRADLSAVIDQVAEANGGAQPLVFLDSLATLLDATDENSREGFAPVGEWLIELRGRGVVPVVFHHTGWDREHGRGTSAREDILDSVIRLRAPGDRETFDGARFEVVFDKSRNLGPGEAQGFELTLETGPSGGVVFSRSEIGDRHESDLRAAIAEVVSINPGCSMRQVCAEVGSRWRDTTKTIHQMIAVGELLNEGKGRPFKLLPTVARGGLSGNTPGNTKTTPDVARENPTGNRAATPGQQLGNTPGNSGVAVLPPPTEGGGQHRGQTPGRKSLPVDLETWPTEDRDRVAELVKDGRSTMAAVEKVQAEIEDRDGTR